MANFTQTVRRNLKQDPIPTVAVTLGILVAMVAVFVLIGVTTGTRMIALLVAIPLTILLATRVRQLGWYFGINLGDKGATYLEAQDAVLSFGVFAALAVLSSFLTRPNVRVVVKPDTIKFGSYRFDRRYVGGLREGFKSQGVQTRPSFVSPKFGSTNLYMEYGAWGERMKYLVDADSAVETIVWANEIIDRVGKTDAVAPNASEGVKAEML